MENIKLYINAGIDEVKIYLEQLFNNINKRNPKFEGAANIKNNFWNSIYDKLNIYSNLLSNDINGCDISVIKFLLFGIGGQSNKVININLEVYEQSIYSNEINNFRNCVIIILIQNYILSETKDKENLSENNGQNILNSIIKIIKCSYIKKSIHVIKSLIKKQLQTKLDIFIPVLFYFIYEKYKNNFISFISSDNCDIKSEYKNILISEYSSFDYNETSSMNFNSKIFEIKLSYSLLGSNPKEKNVIKFLENIKDKKLRGNLLCVFEKYYYENYVRKENNENKNGKLINVLNEVQVLKKNVKEIKNSLDELKDMQKNYMDDIFRILNIINK
jgi:hypothetical protein